MSLQAAFRKRFKKAASRPGLPPVPGPSRKISSHKDKRGSTAHHGGAGAGSTMPGERQTPGGVRIPERMVTPRKGDYHYPDKPQRRAGGKFKQIPADNPYAGGHRNVVAATMKAAVTKAVRMVSKHKDKRGSTAHHKDSFAPSLHGRQEAEERERKERFQQDAEQRYDAPSGPYDEEDV